MQNISAQDYLTTDFFEFVGLKSLSEDQKDHLLEKMNQTVLARVYAHVYSQLNQAEQEELDNISVDNIIPFFETRGFDVPSMIVQEAMQYRIELAHMLTSAEEVIAPVTVSSTQLV